MAWVGVGLSTLLMILMIFTIVGDHMETPIEKLSAVVVLLLVMTLDVIFLGMALSA